MLRACIAFALLFVTSALCAQTLVVDNDIDETVRIYVKPSTSRQFSSGPAYKNSRAYFPLTGSDPFDLAIRDQRNVRYNLGAQPLRQLIAADPGFTLKVSGIYAAGTKNVHYWGGRRRGWICRQIQVTERAGMQVTFQFSNGTGQTMTFELP